MHFFNLTQEQLAELLLPVSGANPKRARMRVKQISKWVYQRLVGQWSEMTDLSKDLRAWLESNIELSGLTPAVPPAKSEDGTTKFLWKLSDGKTIESVIIPAEGRLTACISSQVGCAMACRFCLTGIQGIDRSLRASEIIGQVWELKKVAPITNVVFMGMGEPLQNLEAVIPACRVLTSPDGFGLSKRKVTVSTSGIVPAIEELGRAVDVSLAISLNATTDELRSDIMPVNKKWNIATLLAACKKYPLGPHRFITFEYVLLKDLNDSLDDARRLLKLTRGIPSKINLIPFNEHSGSGYGRPSDDTIRSFQKVLLDADATATVRRSRGRDILAACGQLRSKFGTARGTEKHGSVY